MGEEPGAGPGRLATPRRGARICVNWSAMAIPPTPTTSQRRLEGEGAARSCAWLSRSARLNQRDFLHQRPHRTFTARRFARLKPSRLFLRACRNWRSVPQRRHGHMLGITGAVEMAICIKPSNNIVPPTIITSTRTRNAIDYVRTPLGKCRHAVLNNSFGFVGLRRWWRGSFARIKDVYMNPSSAYLPRHVQPNSSRTNAQALVGCQTSRSSGGRVFRHLSAGMRVTGGT